MENIPPTADALLQHARRAAYQASVWATSEKAQQRRPTPESCMGLDLGRKQQEMGNCLDDTGNSQQSIPVTGEVWL